MGGGWVGGGGRSLALNGLNRQLLAFLRMVGHRGSELPGGLPNRTGILPFPMIKNGSVGFPGGAAVKNLPASAGDTGSSPGPGWSHMPRSNWACAPQLLSLRSRARAPQQEKPPQ